MRVVFAGRFVEGVLIYSQEQATRGHRGDGAVVPDEERRRSAVVADLSDQSSTAGAENHQVAQGVFPFAGSARGSNTLLVAEIDRPGGGDVQLVAGSDVHAGIYPLFVALDADVGALLGGGLVVSG